MQTRSAPAVSIDVENRTVEVAFTTGAAVRRRRYTGWDSSVPFDEILEVSRSAINLDRLNKGAPALDSHSAYRTSSQVGVIEKAWIDGAEGRALIRFPSKGVDPNADRMFAMVSEKIIRNVSVGYSIDEVRVVEPEKKGEVEKRIATRWTPFEVSFVTIPADADAQVRGSDETFPVTISRAAPETKESKMDENETTVTTTETRTAPVVVPPAPASAPAVTENAIRAAVEAERARVAGITELAVRHRLDGFAAQHVAAGTTIEAARAAALESIAARADTSISSRSGDVSASVGHEAIETTRDALENAILHRANPAATKLTDAAREWRGMSLMEMGRLYVEQTSGARLRGLGKMELASRLLGLDNGFVRSGGAMSSTDFPNILANVVSKRLRSAYEVAPQNWKRLARQNNAPDFKARAITQLSNLPNLKPIKEGGEYTHAALADSKESYSLATYGRKVMITRQALINDDLGAFDRVPMLFGRAAAETEASLFWAIITSNPAMGDGVALFHATHKNLGTPGAIAIASLNEGRTAMRKQKGLANKAADAEPLNLTPAMIVVSPDKETEVQQFLSTTIYPQSNNTVNPFAGSLEPIVEARLSGNGWYLFADPATIDTLEYAYLEGEEGLYTESRIGFDVDGVEIKGRLDFAAKAIDYRGMFYNAGN